jgi:hypothetical protein
VAVEPSKVGAKVTLEKNYDLTSVTKYARLVSTSRGGTRPEEGEEVNNMNTKAQVKGRLSAEDIANALASLTGDFYTKADFGLLDRGVERWTYCSIVYILAEMLGEEYDGAQEPFLEACRYYEVADHACMAEFPKCTIRDKE